MVDEPDLKNIYVASYKGVTLSAMSITLHVENTVICGSLWRRKVYASQDVTCRPAAALILVYLIAEHHKWEGLSIVWASLQIEQDSHKKRKIFKDGYYALEDINKEGLSDFC